MPHILNLKNLKKSYKSRDVVNGVSFSVKSGEIVGLLGPNGAGKTTAFYMAIGLIIRDSGQVFFDDHDISHYSMHRRAKMGMAYLPQEASIFRKLSVANNIAAILELRKDINKKQRREKLESLLQEFHIAHIRDHLGVSLSGGERRRVEIARTLATEPKFVLLDEPFAGIDPISVVDIKHLIRHLCERGIGILITDHNVRETLGICERAYIMSDGKIICSGSPDIILKNPQVRKVYLGEDFVL